MSETIVLDEQRAARDAAAVVRALRERGVREGDVVAVIAGNGVEAIAARDATMAMGVVMAPVNPRLTGAEIEVVVAKAGAKAVLVDRMHGRDGAIGIEDEIAKGGGPDVSGVVRARAGATLLFTSGTTGQPKACLRREAHDEARIAELTESYGLRGDDVHLIACPLAHSAPGIFLRACRRHGARTVVQSAFRAEAFVDAVRVHRASVFFLVPTQWQRLLALPRERADWSSVRCAIVAGAPIGRDTKRRIAEWIGPGKLWEFYGSSETGTVTVIGPDEHEAHPGSVGRAPRGVSLRLHDGEVFVQSDAVMAGYLQEDGAVVRPEERDGHVSVGDLGALDGEWLTLIDRKHDTIITGGVNVYPAEVERALGELPGVAGAVVFGVDDPEWGQRVAAVIAGDGLEPRALIAALRERLAGYKLPRAVALCAPEDLPIGSSGKALRRAARARFAAQLVSV
jgi:long-chain acyl-CoA synthetase